MKIFNYFKALEFLIINPQKFDDIKINQGQILSNLNENKISTNLRDYEFKVFSQWGEDGIIQYLIKSIEIENNTFIEFGVENFFESNCRFLLMNNNWKGFVIDGSTKNIEKLKNSYFFWKHDLMAVSNFITKDNIEKLLYQSGFDEDLGILSIDLDGNDYYVFEAIKYFKPRILICEFNSLFGATRKISIPYKADFIRSVDYANNLYWGASLAALTYLAKNKGYSLVGTNIANNNAFYVRNDLINEKVKVLSAEEAHSFSDYRESRSKDGTLSYVSGEKRLDLLKGFPVFEVEKKVMEFI